MSQSLGYVNRFVVESHPILSVMGPTGVGKSTVEDLSIRSF